MGARSIETTPAERKTFQLSERLSVDLVIWPGSLFVEWKARPAKLTEAEQDAYTKAWNEMADRLEVISHETV
jgi:hypothetical protein